MSSDIVIQNSKKKERKIKDSGSEWDTVHIFKNVHMIIKGDRRK